MTDLPKLDGPALPPLAGGPPEKVVILCHGYGANGQDLVGLALGWREPFPTTAFFSPNAPEPVPGAPGGFQWWGIGSMSRDEREQGVTKAAPILDAFIDQTLENTGLTEKDLALVGFSQGTMMALHVGLSRPNPVAGILGYSGAIASGEVLSPLIKNKPPIQLVHGDMDQMIPSGAMDSAATFLRGEGLEVETHLSPGVGHGIAPDGIEIGTAFLHKVLNSK